MKRALKIIAGLFVLFLIIIISFLMTFDVNQYKGQIVNVVKQKTERAFSIDGDLHLEPSLIPTIAVEGVKFGNAEWGSKPDMVTVGKFEAQIALLPLLSRNIEVKRLILNDATILLEKNKKGVANWTLSIAEDKADESKKAPAPSEPATLPALDINEVMINNATLTYADAATGQIEKVSLRELDIKAGGYSAPLAVLLDASYNGIPVSLNGTGGSLKSLVNKEVYELDVRSKIGKIEAELAGKIADLQQLKGLDINIGINLDNLQDVGVLIKQELPDAGPVEFKASIADKDEGVLLKSLTATIDKLSLNADGEISNINTLSGIKLNFDASVGRLSDLNKLAGGKLPEMGPFTLNGTATDIEGGYKLAGFKLGLEKTDLAGEAAINLSGKRPALTVNTTSNLVDLTPFISDEQKKSAEKKSKVFSAEPLPFDLLKKADVNASVKANKIQHPSFPLENVTLSLTLNNGNLNIKPLEFGTLGAAANLTVGLDASDGKSGKLKTRLNIKGIELSKMPNQKGKLEGAKTDVEIDVTGSGASVAEIMAGLNGKFLTQIGPGKIKSSSPEEENRSLLLMTFNNIYGSMTKSETILECGVVKANIEDGIATINKGIAFQTKAMNLVGSGMINFKTEELEIGIDPEARKGLGLNVGQLAELVAIRGTLANPKAGPSTKEALKTAASVGAAVMTGGLSILAQGLFDRATSDDNPCVTALGKSATPSKKADTKKQTAEPKKSDSDSLKDKIRGLFN